MEIDTHLIRDISLFQENQEISYKRLQSVIKRLQYFKKKDIFDRKKALKLIGYLLKDLLKEYNKENSSDLKLNKLERIELIEEIMKNIELREDDI